MLQPDFKKMADALKRDADVCKHFHHIAKYESSTLMLGTAHNCLMEAADALERLAQHPEFKDG